MSTMIAPEKLKLNYDHYNYILGEPERVKEVICLPCNAVNLSMNTKHHNHVLLKLNPALLQATRSLQPFEPFP